MDNQNSSKIEILSTEEDNKVFIKSEPQGYDSISEEINNSPKEIKKDEKVRNRRSQNTHNTKKQKIHQCPICLKHFTRLTGLKYHLKLHSGIKDYVCTICDKRVAWKKNLIAHMLSHKEKNSFLCHLCPKSYKNPSSLKYHVQTHLAGTSFTCEICKKKFQSVYLLTIHKKIHTLANNFDCDICRRTFRSHRTLKYHIIRHMELKNYECPVCLKCFPTQVELKVHILDHLGIVECDICTEKFLKIEDFNSHILLHDDIIPKIVKKKMYEVPVKGSHPKDCDKFMCPICSKTFLRFEYLYVHLPSHFGFKFYDCKLCQKIFPYSCQLRIHLIAHKLRKDEEKMKCNVCSKNFSHRRDLLKHKKCHIIRECEICKVKFKTLNTLRKHRKLHFKENIFECDICKVKLTSIGLYFHKKTSKICQKMKELQKVNQPLENVELKLVTGDEGDLKSNYCKKSELDLQESNLEKNKNHLKTYMRKKKPEEGSILMEKKIKLEAEDSLIPDESMANNLDYVCTQGEIKQSTYVTIMNENQDVDNGFDCTDEEIKLQIKRANFNRTVIRKKMEEVIFIQPDEITLNTNLPDSLSNVKEKNLLIYRNSLRTYNVKRKMKEKTIPYIQNNFDNSLANQVLIGKTEFVNVDHDRNFIEDFRIASQGFSVVKQEPLDPLVSEFEFKDVEKNEFS